MKRFAKHIIFYALALYLTSQIVSGLTVAKGIDTLLLAALILAILHALFEPVFNIFLMPLSVLTFGLITSIATLASMFVLTKVFTKVSIHPFKFEGMSFFGVEIKPFSAGILLSYVIVSVIIFAIVRFLRWVSEE